MEVRGGVGGSSSSCSSTWGGWAMGGCGSRAGWARAGDTAGGRAGLGGRAAARLLGRDGCWGRALCKAGRTQQRTVRLLRPQPGPSFHADLLPTSLQPALSPQPPSNSRTRRSQEGLQIRPLPVTLPCAEPSSFLTHPPSHCSHLHTHPAPDRPV